MPKVIENVEIGSGKVYHQPEFPFCRFAVLMLPDAPLKFGRLSCEQGEVPNIITDPDRSGRWQYTEDELLNLIERLGYEYLGESEGSVE